MVNKVMVQQFYLNCLGYNAGKVDGIFGNRTIAASKRFYDEVVCLKSDEVRRYYSIEHEAEQKLPRHLLVAAQYLGEKEIPGLKHNLKIGNFWSWLTSKIRDDETPYCAVFLGHCLVEAGYISATKLKENGVTASARSLMNYGFGTGGNVGDIAVFWRGKRDGWKGHTGFIVGINENGDFWILGGNQGNSVSMALISKDRLLGFRGYEMPYRARVLPLPLITAAAVPSTNEA